MRKILLIIGVAAIVLAVVATVGLYWFFSGDAMRRALEQQASAWLGQPVTIASARAQLFPRPGIALTGIEIGQPVQLTLANVDLSTDLGALLRRRIEDASLVISDSRIQMPLAIALPEDSAASAPASAEAPAIQLVSVREILLRDVRIASRGREVRVSADSALAGNHLTVRRFAAESGNTSLQVQGEVDLEPSVDAKLTATANKIDVDELLALADAFSPESGGKGGRASPAMKVVASLDADSATAGSVQVSKFSTELLLDADRVRLSPLTFGLFGGQYQGSLNARLGQQLSATLQSRLEGLDVAQLAAFGGSPDTITGTLSGDGTFSVQGADMAGALANASGKGSASIRSGTIKRLNLVRTVVLFFGRPAPSTAEATNQFDSIDANFSLSGGVFRADQFSLRSRDADIDGTATLALETKALNGTVEMTLSEELSAQAGTDLARFTREGNRIVLPANLGGTLDQPRITINAAAAVKRGLRNEIQRQLKGLFGR